MSDADDKRRRRGRKPTKDERTEVDPRLPSPPGGVSRVDTLPEDFVKFLSRRPHFIGDVIAGRYKLVEHLGDGAMGQVFAAENLAIGRRVAVKVLKAELLADAHFRARFQREAEAIAAIDHRNVVRFLDLVVGDPVFLVMECLVGPTLASVLKGQRKLDPVRAINIATRLCWGLDAAHRAGVIHRDIKPANVILSPDPELGEEPRLIDFGLAKLANLPAEDQLTRTGQIIGTPHYMSPEQISNRDIDARSDVYSLGCLLYHMLAGRPPFPGTDDVQILYQQIQHEPAPLREVAPEVPSDLDLVLRCALAKQPDQRFASVREMVKALGTVERRQSSDSIGSTRDATTELIRSPQRRRWRKALPLVALVALATCTVEIALLLSRRTERLASGGGLLVVDSQPSGASVQIDGRALPEATPTAVRGLSPGKHVVRVRGSGPSSTEQIVMLAPGERVVVDVALPAASHVVEVQTVPPGAFVYLDDHLQVGQTPLTVTIADNEFQELRLEKAGYESATRALRPDDHRSQLTINLEAEKQPRGTLWVDANRAAQVFLDGADTRLVTPTLGVRVSAGDHLVELRDSSGRTGASAHIRVEQGETAHVTLDFTPVSR